MNDSLRTDEDVFKRLAQEVSQVTGVVLGDKQSSLIQSRLLKRVRDLGYPTALTYWDHFKKNRQEEMLVLISLLTTHHTFFFREFAHFEFVAQELPNLIAKLRKQGRRKIRIWSAACSFGHEVYSLAMFMDLKLKQLAPDFDFEIFGTDVDEKSVKIGNNGVYKWDEVQKIPSQFLSDHWARGTGEIKDYVKVKSALKAKCRFQAGNLLKISQLKEDKFDFIFCRNVFIYFTREQIREVVQQLHQFMTPGGHLILGLSESLYELDVPVNHLGKAIYINGKAGSSDKPASDKPASDKPASDKPASPTPRPASAPALVQPASEDLIRVVCVDDSPSVLKLLGKMFEKNPRFKVVGTAKNGIEAGVLMKTLRADVMTLDIHMPEQDGIEYLKANYKIGHPPVVMVSSVARGDSKFAIKALEYGACDYIEKPALDNFDKVTDEVLMKIEIAAKSSKPVIFSKLEVEKSFMKNIIIPSPDQKAVILFFNLADKQKASYILKGMMKPHPPVFLCLQTMQSLKEDLIPTLTKELKVELQAWSPTFTGVENRFYYLHPEDLDKALDQLKNKTIATGVLGPIGSNLENQVRKVKSGILLSEDLGIKKPSTSLLTSPVPYTSFSYDLCHYLSGMKKVA